MTWSRTVWWLLAAGFLLLPFSLTAGGRLGEPGFVAVSLGLPLVFLAALIFVMSGAAGIARLPRGLSLTLVAAAVHAGFIVWYSAYATSLGGMIARSAGALLGLAVFLYLCSLGASARGNDERYRRLLWVIAASGAILALYYSVNFAVRSLEFGLVAVIGSRTVGGLAALPWHASNVVGGAMLYPWCLMFLIEPRTRGERLALRVLMAVIALALLLTMSLGAIGSAIVFLLLAVPAGGRLRALGAVALSLAAAAVVLRLATGEHFGLVLQYAFELQNSRGDVTNNRMEGYVAALRYFAERPLEPVGYGAAAQIITPDGTHNIWLAYLLEMGPLGVASLAALVAMLVWRAALLTRSRARTDRRAGWLFVALLASVFLHMMVETPIYTQQAALYFWAAAGLLVWRSRTGTLNEAAP